jgi:hypothetical protein
LGDLGLDGRKILYLIFNKCNGSVNGMDLGQERDRWQVVVNVVMNLRVA